MIYDSPTSLMISPCCRYYCWWQKSCTTKDDDYPILYRVSTIPGGAGFHPSTVSQIHPLERHSLSRIFGTEVDEKMAKESYSACLEQKTKGWYTRRSCHKGVFVVCKDRIWDFMDADSWWWWWLLLFAYYYCILLWLVLYDDDVC